jgi:hypothetical protein
MADLPTYDDPPWWELLWFTQPHREQHARERLITHPRIVGLRIATATTSRHANPADRIWRPLSPSTLDDRAYRLAELPDLDGENDDGSHDEDGEKDRPSNPANDPRLTASPLDHGTPPTPPTS